MTDGCADTSAQDAAAAVEKSESLQARTCRVRFFVFGFTFMASAVLVAAMFLPMKRIITASEPPKYTGTARFERRSPPATENDVDAGRDFIETYSPTLRTNLAGRPAIEAVVHDLKMDQDLPHEADGMLSPEGRRRLQGMVADIQESIEITYDVQTPLVDVIAVSFTSSDHDAAKDVPNALVEHYIMQTMEAIVSQLELEYNDILKDSLYGSRRLEEARRSRADFEVQHAGQFLDAEVVGAQIAGISDEIAALKATVVDGQPATVAKTIAGKTDEIKRLRERLSESFVLRLERERLVAEEAKFKAEADHYQAQLALAERDMRAELSKRRTLLVPLEEASEPVGTRTVKSHEPGAPALWYILVAAGGAGLLVGVLLAALPIRIKRAGRVGLTVVTCVLVLVAAAASFVNSYGP